MTELEKIEYAKSFIDKLANGINPLDGTPIPEEDIANHIRLSRCFFYVSDILRQVIENGGIHPAPMPPPVRGKKAFSLADEDRERILISSIPVSASEITEQLNSFIDLNTTKKISSRAINNWLLELQLLELVTTSSGKTRKHPTKQGKELGILTEERTGQHGTYLAILFSPSAQQFIYDNIEAIVEANRKGKEKTAEFQGAAWSVAHDECLIDLYGKGVPVSEIAVTLKRTVTGIRARLKRLGVIENRNDAK